jgi:hypothetical protein
MQNTLGYNKFCLTLGFGGHGSACVSDHIILNPETRFDIILVPMDDGGCSGRIQKYFTKSVSNLTKEEAKRFNLNKSPIALGDLKNNIKVWLTKTITYPVSVDIVIKAFELRSDNILVFKENFDQLSIIFPFLEEYRISFGYLAESYLETLSESADSGESTSFANILLQVIYNQSQNAESFIQTLKNNKLIPANVNIHFLLERQLKLQAETEKGCKLKCESELDVHYSDPVILESYKLFDDVKNAYLNAAQIFQENLSLVALFQEYENEHNSNGYILFPAGSISNLFPLLNILNQQIRDLKLPIFWITNSFIQGNEQPLPIQILEIHKMFAGNGLPIMVLGASKNPFDFIHSKTEKTEMIKKYEAENKKQISQHEVAKQVKKINLNTIYIPKLSMVKVKNAGLKYPTFELNTIINRILNRWLLILEQPNISDKKILSLLISSLKPLIPKEYKIKIYKPKKFNLKHTLYFNKHIQY